MKTKKTSTEAADRIGLVSNWATSLSDIQQQKPRKTEQTQQDCFSFFCTASKTAFRLYLTLFDGKLEEMSYLPFL